MIPTSREAVKSEPAMLNPLPHSVPPLPQLLISALNSLFRWGQSPITEYSFLLSFLRMESFARLTGYFHTPEFPTHYPTIQPSKCSTIRLFD